VVTPPVSWTAAENIGELKSTTTFNDEVPPLPSGLLFVSHDGSRTGAPIALLRFLRWATSQPGAARPEIVLVNDGPLRAEFAEVGRVTTLWSEDSGPFSRRLRRVLRRTNLAAHGDRLRLTRQLGNMARFRLAYFNSVASAPLLRYLSLPRQLPLIAHIHEMSYALSHDVDPVDRDLLLARADHFFTAGEASRNGLIQDYGINPTNVEAIGGFLPIAELVAHQPVLGRSQLLEQLSLPSNALLVGACATRNWRKGTDLFIQMAAHTRRTAPDRPIYFVWVGGDAGRVYQDQLDFDVRHSGLTDRIRFVDTVASAIDYLQAFDIFCLPSREDPFPLVCLEAAAFGKAIVCFDVGGMSTFVGDECGIVVEAEDIAAMSGAVLSLLDQPERAASLGRAGCSKVQRDHDIAVIGPSLLAGIHHQIAQSTRISSAGSYAP